MSLPVDIEHGCLHTARPPLRAVHDKAGPQAGAFARAQQTPPIVHSILFQQQNLNLPAAPGIDRPESGRNHTRIVQDQNVSRSKIVDDLSKPPVLGAARVAVKDQQTRCIAARRRHLGDPFRRKFEVKIGRSHLAAILPVPGSTGQSQNCE